MPSLTHKRGTRLQIDAAALLSQLKAGEVYLITDEGRLTVGTAANAHSPAAKQSEAGGGGGASGTVGTGEIDFGAHPGSSKATLVITGQAAIVAGSVVEAWVVAKDTVDHSTDEHLVDPPRLICGAIVPGTGFTIYAMPRETRPRPLSPLHRGQRKTAKSSLPYGKWSIAWRWQ